MLVGYAARTEPSRGVVHPIYVRAIAFEDQPGQRKVLITADLIGFSRVLSDEISLQVEKEFNISRECLIFSASHTHSPFAELPEITNVCSHWEPAEDD